MAWMAADGNVQLSSQFHSTTKPGRWKRSNASQSRRFEHEVDLYEQDVVSYT